MKVEVLTLGREREPLVVVDGWSGAPEMLADDAARRSFSPAPGHYPGVRAAAPHDLLAARAGVLERVAREVFGAGGLDLEEHSYSVVATPPGELSPVQRLPHFDGLRPRLALLHVLRPAGQGGTRFYRQSATGFETVREANFADFEARLREDVGGGPPEGYPRARCGFETVHEAEPAVDRALIYRGRLLHSGAIVAPDALSADPRVGRLTVNTFFGLR